MSRAGRLDWLDKYSARLQPAGDKFMLSGVDGGLINSLEKAEAVGRLGPENILSAERQLFASTEKALEAAKSWIEDPTQGNQTLTQESRLLERALLLALALSSR